MIILGIVLIIICIILFCYSITRDNLIGFLLFLASVICGCLGVLIISDDINNLKTKGKEIKNVKDYNVKSTIILEDNIPTDTIYTIYYKKK